MRGEFYFIRHGQTDHNISEHNRKVDHPAHIPLNAKGREQAARVEPLIARLPIKAVYASPLKRAQETKEIITPRLSVPHFDIPELGECTAQIWDHIYQRGPSRAYELDEVHRFFERVERGLHLALQQELPILIVAHGGVHWAICYLLQIENHTWTIDNCLPVHFQKRAEGNWIATPLGDGVSNPLSQK